jgi:hypothetical protein
MRLKVLCIAATVSVAACSNAAAPNDVQVEDIIGVVSTEQAPYFDGNTLRVIVTNLRLSPTDQASELNVAIDPNTLVRVAARGCEIRTGSRSEITAGAEISIRLRNNTNTLTRTYQAAQVTISL